MAVCPSKSVHIARRTQRRRSASRPHPTLWSGARQAHGALIRDARPTPRPPVGAAVRRRNRARPCAAIAATRVVAAGCRCGPVLRWPRWPAPAGDGGAARWLGCTAASPFLRHPRWRRPRWQWRATLLLQARWIRRSKGMTWWSARGRAMPQRNELGQRFRLRRRSARWADGGIRCACRRACAGLVPRTPALGRSPGTCRAQRAGPTCGPATAGAWWSGSRRRTAISIRMASTTNCGCGSRACRPPGLCANRSATTARHACNPPGAPVERAREAVRDAILEPRGRPRRPA
jgi:hypothetical protein